MHAVLRAAALSTAKMSPILLLFIFLLLSRQYEPLGLLWLPSSKNDATGEVKGSPIAGQGLPFSNLAYPICVVRGTATIANTAESGPLDPAEI